MRIARQAFCALGLISLLSSTVHAEPVPPEPIDALRAEGLCPGGLAAGLIGGKLGEAVDHRLLDAFSALGPEHKPFTRMSAVTTDWSGRLAGLEWTARFEDGVNLRDWRDSLQAKLQAHGWNTVDDARLKSSNEVDSVLLGKVLDSPLGARPMVVEIDSSGAFLVRCSDQELLLLDAAERSGDLPPGTPRPVAPAEQGQLALPQRSECDRPEWKQAFAEITYPDQVGPTLARLVPSGLPASDRAVHGERLNRWIHWKMIGSGKVNEEQLFSLEFAAAPEAARPFESGEHFLGTFGELFAAIEKRDAAAICKGTITLLEATSLDDQRKAARLEKQNAALEAEARRLQISLD